MIALGVVAVALAERGFAVFVADFVGAMGNNLCRGEKLDLVPAEIREEENRAEEVEEEREEAKE